MNNTFAGTWRANWNARSFRFQVIGTPVLLALILFSLTSFLNRVEQRPGAVLADPLLALFEPRDVTWITFGCIYLGLVAGIVVLARHPRLLLLAVQSYIVMVALRIMAMYLVPLDPPAGMIALKDPFVEFFGTGRLLTKDLFFSGHTSTLLLFFLIVPGRGEKILFCCCTLAVAVCVLLQHVHYSIDVFAALFFGYSAYRIALNAQRWIDSIIHI